MKKIYKVVLSVAVLSSLGACSSMKTASFVEEQDCTGAPNKELEIYCHQNKASLGNSESAAFLALYYRKGSSKDSNLAEEYKEMVMRSGDLDSMLAVLRKDEETKEFEIIEQKARKGDVKSLRKLINNFGTEPYTGWVLDSGNDELMMTLFSRMRGEDRNLSVQVLEKAASLGNQEALEYLSHYKSYSLSHDELNLHHRTMAERGYIASIKKFLLDDLIEEKWIDNAIENKNVEALKVFLDYLKHHSFSNESNYEKVRDALVDLGDLETISDELDFIEGDKEKEMFLGNSGISSNLDRILSELEGMDKYEINRYYGHIVKYLSKQRYYPVLELSFKKYLVAGYRIDDYVDMKDKYSMLLAARYFSKRNQELSIELYESLTEKNYSLAEIELLRLYLQQGSRYLKKNTRKIHALLDNMIEDGNVEAMVVKADINLNRNHYEVRTDRFEEALMLYQRAYDNGYRSFDEKLLLLYGGIYIGQFEANNYLKKKSIDFVSMQAKAGNEMALKILEKAEEIKSTEVANK
ncbi:hypothetical protein [Neptuniibacter sp. QD34_54]|uniref:hypothetical protein n=1 Tax=Neptuniibacter sp. QD34_54 TaxID=3398208 RepID=UPI0039F54597